MYILHSSKVRSYDVKWYPYRQIFSILQDFRDQLSTSKCDFVKKLSRVRCPHRRGVSVDWIEQQYCNDFLKKRAWNWTRRIYVVCAEKRSSSSTSLTYGSISWNDTDKGRQILVNVRSLLEEQETIRSDSVDAYSDLDSVFAVTHQLESFKRLLHCDN